MISRRKLSLKKSLLAVPLLMLTLLHQGFAIAQGNNPVSPISVDWSRDGTKIAVGYSNGSVDVLDALTGQLN